MANYDCRGDGQTEIRADEFGHFFNMKIRLNIATQIAAHATPTSNGYFSTSDTLQIGRYPARCIPIGFIYEIVTAGTSTCTADVGRTAGGQDWIAGLDADGAAGYAYYDPLFTDSAAAVTNYISANQIYYEVLTANQVVGVYNLFFPGIDLLAQ